jgi:hypothetical protein
MPDGFGHGKAHPMRLEDALMKKNYKKPALHTSRVALGVYGTYNGDDTGRGGANSKPNSDSLNRQLYMD